MAQFGRALRSGRRGRVFESRHLDQKFQGHIVLGIFNYYSLPLFHIIMLGDNMKKVLFIKNALILTVTALILRFVGIIFRVWLADSIGAEGMGLYQVIFSVYVFASTFATSGISTAVTRIVTERLAVYDVRGARRTVRVSVLISLVLAFLTSAVIIIFASPISKYLVGDVRALPSIKILCLGLPFMGVASCLRGYFLARRSTIPPSVCQIIEQCVRMAVIVFLLSRYGHLGLTYSATAVLFGDSVSQAVSTAILYVIYKFNIKKARHSSAVSLRGRAAAKEIGRITLPISGGRYLHTGLRTAENLITPTCLLKYSASKSAALEQFGMIKGMALPLLLFPASLLSAISTLLVPEITENRAGGNTLTVKAAVEKIFYITAVISFLIGGIFFSASYQIGQIFYKSAGVGYLIRALSPLIPFMYIDLISDGILKGLDKQGFLFKINLIDSAARVILVVIFVPKFGLTAFLGVMFFSNIFTGAASVIKIVKTVGLKFNMQKYFFLPLFAAFFSAFVSDFLCNQFQNNYIMYVIVSSLCQIVLYFVVLTFFGVIDFNIFKKQKRFK